MALRKLNPAVAAHPLAQLDCITVELDWDSESQAWVTHIPELYGISSYGVTQEEALNNTQEMLAGWLDSMRDNDHEIPLKVADLTELRRAIA